MSFNTRGLQNNDHSTLPAVWLRQIVKKKINMENCVRIFKSEKKNVQVSVHRLKFPRKCLKNDLMPYFLKIRIPENGVFFRIKLGKIFN